MSGRPRRPRRRRALPSWSPLIIAAAAVLVAASVSVLAAAVLAAVLAAAAGYVAGYERGIRVPRRRPAAAAARKQTTRRASADAADIARALRERADKVSERIPPPGDDD